ncbi:MAG: hypothetical protein V3R78_10175 [Thermodesulfobacteriota bacterium]
MAVPTNPTATTLVSEAIKKAGHSSPTSGQITRAEDFFMQEIKNDIHTLAKKPKFLHTTSILVLTEGKNRYANPTDYSSDMEMTLLSGTNDGTAQDGAVGSITLAATDSFIDSGIVGKEILITANTGAGSMSQVTAYDDTTKVATVTPDFTTTPDNTSTYSIIDAYDHLEQTPSFEFDRKVRNDTLLGRPTHFMPIGSANEGEFTLYPTPYTDDTSVYGIRLRYYANIMELDNTGTLMTKLYSTLRNIWIAGVKAKQLEDDMDNRQFAAKQEYNSALQAVIMREQYGMDLNGLVMSVSDYN